MESSPTAQDLFDILGKVNEVCLHFIVFPGIKLLADVDTSPCHIVTLLVALALLVSPPGSLLWRSYHQDGPFSTMVTKTEFSYHWEP